MSRDDDHMTFFWFGLVWLLIGTIIGALTTNAAIRNHMTCSPNAAERGGSDENGM